MFRINGEPVQPQPWRPNRRLNPKAKTVRYIWEYGPMTNPYDRPRATGPGRSR